MKHVIVGLVASLLGVWGIITWWSTFAVVMRGVVPFGLLIFGLVAILSGSRSFLSAGNPDNGEAQKDK